MNAQKQHILFLNFSSINNSSVRQSQVLEQIKFLAQEGFQVTLLTYEDIAEQLSYSEALEDNDVELFLNHTLNRLLRTFTMFRQSSKIIARSEHIDFIYYRDIWMGLVAEAVKHPGIQTIYNIRALIAEESAYRNHRKFPNYYILKLLEYALLKSADRILAVSHPLKSYVLRKVPRKRVTVIPTCVNEENVYFDARARDDIRDTLGLHPEDTLLVYVGGSSKWQSLDQILRLFTNLSQEDNQVYLMLITTPTQHLTEAIDSLESKVEERIFLEHVDHGEVHRYLSAADAGLLIREDAPLNKVSAPIKFAEYLVSGLPTIITAGVGDYNQLVVEHQLGIIIPYHEITSSRGIKQVRNYIDYLRGEREELRNRCIEAARRNLTWRSHREKLFSVFADKRMH